MLTSARKQPVVTKVIEAGKVKAMISSKVIIGRLSSIAPINTLIGMVFLLMSAVKGPVSLVV